MSGRCEASRLRALDAYGVLDTPPEEAFDRLTQLAADLFDAPIALVSLVDAERQWFKSRYGLAAESTPRSLAFCAHAIELEAGATLVVEDASRDLRFQTNPLVTSDPNIRFYAGAVLTSADGHNLGTLCVIDTEVRQTPSPQALRRLQILARIVVDELELRRAKRLADEKSRLLDMAERMSGVGSWRYDFADGRSTWSDELYEIHGVSRDTFEPNYDDSIIFFPDEDRATLKRLMGQARETGEGYEFELNLRRHDGEMRIVAAKAECLMGTDGRVSALCGVFQDITAQKRAVAALAESERRFRQLAVNAPDIIAETTLGGVLTYLSPACLAVTGYTAEELVGRPFESLIDPADARRVVEMCRATFVSKGAVPSHSVEVRARHKSGRPLWLECKPTLVADPLTGRFTGLADVIRDITERKVLEDELRRSQRAAEAAAAVKSEFLANMSHELRTPLTSIVGFTRLAGEQSDLGELTRTYVERVENASQALLCTVNDILDFSKLEAGQVQFHVQPTLLTKLGRATLDLFTPQAGAKDLTLTLEEDAETRDLAISVDPDRIRQILLNLVGNAVKFTVQGGVTLRTRYDATDAQLCVDVIDTGPGVSADMQTRLFQRFSQIDGSMTRSHGGTGLGLAICKGLVEAMGGEIGIDSTEGGGSRFWFKVPAALTRQGPAQADVAVDSQSLTGVRVLVVDDHPANRELARLFLTGMGAEVSEAADGAEAADLAEIWPYDAILMDLRMPGLDGPGGLKRIRETPGPNDATPILAFTADADSTLMDRLVELGFQDVVAKPLEPGALIRAIARATTYAWDMMTYGNADAG